MEIEALVGPGRPSWTTKEYNGINWEADGLLDLLKVRCRSLIAASFAEGNWHQWPWRSYDWRSVAVATRKALSLFIQAEAVHNTTAQSEDLPEIIFCVELEGADPVEYVIGNPGTRVTPKISCPFQTAVSGETRTGKITVAFKQSAQGHDETYQYIGEQLTYQASLQPCPQMYARPGFGTVAPTTLGERQWDARVRFSDFLRRFLHHYNRTHYPNTPLGPFMAFFLVPQARYGQHIPSGMWGYRYQLDDGQAEFLKQKGVAPEELGNHAVKFPEGLCSQVYLSGRAVDPVSTQVLLTDYRTTSAALLRIETEILRPGSVLLEIPVHETGLIDSDLAPDGPECILGVCIPYAQRMEGRAAPRNEHFAIKIVPPFWSGLKPGECQAVFEMAHHLISRYVRIRPSAAVSGLIGRSRPMQLLQDLIDRVARVDSHVLVFGGPGSGKEVVARAIAALSPRAPSGLTSVNCAAFPAELIENELFGHVEGAFSGALRGKGDKGGKLGYFHVANHGTLFLDEIGELPLPAQAKLLRVLQFGEVQRVGSTTKEVVDVRVIAATNRNLDEDVRLGRFRQDLFSRLNVLPISVPALCDHPEDIPDLVEHCLHKLKKPHVFDESAMSMLMKYNWSVGNVRELENFIERMTVFLDTRIITADQIADHLPRSPEAGGGVG